MQENQATFKEIETFMHIVNDWLEETNIAMLSQGASDSQASSFQNEGGESSKVEAAKSEAKKVQPSSMKSRESQKSLTKAAAEAQANI